jgi:isopentenyldiphosphate isomerase
MGNLNTDAIIPKVDDTDRVIGTFNRRDIPRSPANFRVVHLFAFNANGELLMQHIASGHRSEGKWGSTVAGYVLAGETYEDACARKVRNEVRLDDIAVSCIGKTSMGDLGAQKFITLYQAKIDQIPNFDRDQITDMKFVPLTALRHHAHQRPEAYTATLHHLLSFYLDRMGR